MPNALFRRSAHCAHGARHGAAAGLRGWRRAAGGPHLTSVRSQAGTA